MTTLTQTSVSARRTQQIGRREAREPVRRNKRQRQPRARPTSAACARSCDRMAGTPASEQDQLVQDDERSRKSDDEHERPGPVHRPRPPRNSFMHPPRRPEYSSMVPTARSSIFLMRPEGHQIANAVVDSLGHEDRGRAVGLDVLRELHRITPQVVDEFPPADEAADDWAGVDADLSRQRRPALGVEALDDADDLARELDHARRVVRTVHRQTGRGEIRRADRPDFLDTVLLGRFVERARRSRSAATSTRLRPARATSVSKPPRLAKATVTSANDRGASAVAFAHLRGGRRRQQADQQALVLPHLMVERLAAGAQALHHVVEGLAQLAELVLRNDIDLHVQLALADTPGATHQRRQSAGSVARQRRGRAARTEGQAPRPSPPCGEPGRSKAPGLRPCRSWRSRPTGANRGRAVRRRRGREHRGSRRRS